MKKYFVLSVSALLLTGCVTQPFVPKALNEQAKGIATTKTTPYGCKVLGEVEGKDEIPYGTGAIIGNSLLAVREGAINDLRNKAIEVVGNSKKRTVLKLTSGKAMCGNVDCPNQDLEQQRIWSYYIKADVFECGDK